MLHGHVTLITLLQVKSFMPFPRGTTFHDIVYAHVRHVSFLQSVPPKFCELGTSIWMDHLHTGHEASLLSDNLALTFAKQISCLAGPVCTGQACACEALSFSMTSALTDICDEIPQRPKHQKAQHYRFRPFTFCLHTLHRAV